MFEQHYRRNLAQGEIHDKNPPHGFLALEYCAQQSVMILAPTLSYSPSSGASQPL